MGRVAVAYHAADFVHRIVGVLQQCASLFHPFFLNIFTDGGAVALFKDPTELFGRVKALFCEG